MINEFIKWNEAHIIWWRKALKKHMLKEFGVDVKFFPKIEGEENG